MFPDSGAAMHKEGVPAAPTADQVAFQQMLRGIHF
jgi:hypothetical protein